MTARVNVLRFARCKQATTEWARARNAESTLGVLIDKTTSHRGG